MDLSKTTISVLVDLIENKLAVMQIGDRKELREVMTLQRCLGELQTLSKITSESGHHEPRGRHRKFSSMLEDFAAQSATDDRRMA